MQGPEAIIYEMGIELRGVVDPERAAVLSDSHRTIVNGHFYWAADEHNLLAMRQEPARYTGPLLDPVTHEWFTPDLHSPRRDHDGAILLFASDETHRTFEQHGAVFEGHAH